MRKDESPCDCSAIDDVIVFTKEGKMQVVRVDSKVFVGKDIIHAAIFKRNDTRTIYNMIFAHPVGEFVNKHPSLQVLGLSFLMLIGFMLLAEAAHLSHTRVLGNEIGAIPKGYLYFAITFSLLVEFLNMKTRKPKKV